MCGCGCVVCVQAQQLEVESQWKIVGDETLLRILAEEEQPTLYSRRMRESLKHTVSSISNESVHSPTPFPLHS